MNKTIVLVTAFVLASPVFAYEIDVGGKAEIFGTTYFHDKQAADSASLDLRLLPELKLRADKFLVYMQGDLRVDTEEASNGLSEYDGKRSIIALREAFLRYSGDVFDVKIGKLIFDWSVTDTVSPSDNFGARDWLDIIEWERTGVPAIDLRIGSDAFAEFVYVPRLVPSILPEPKTRWSALPVGIGQVDVEAPKDSEQFAIRFGTNWQRYDWSLSYYDGYNYSPAFRLENSNLAPEYQREQVVAGAVAGEMLGFNARVELGYFTQDSNDDYLQYVVGADREWSGVFCERDGFLALVQYSDEAFVVENQNPNSVESFDLKRIFNGAILYRLKYSPDGDMLSGKLIYGLEGIVNLEGGDKYTEVNVTYKGESYEVKMGVGVPTGQDGSFFGQYKENDRVYGKLTWRF